VQERCAVCADARLEFGITSNIGSGQDLVSHIICECRLLGDGSRQPHAGRQRLHILLCAQKVKANLGRRERVRALHPNTAARLRPQMHYVDRKAGEWMGTYFVPIT
jgi:hypothetical protein